MSRRPVCARPAVTRLVFGKAECSECHNEVQIDHVSDRGDVFVMWHGCGSVRRCPGTDHPAVPGGR